MSFNEYIKNNFNQVFEGAPEALDSLNEIGTYFKSEINSLQSIMTLNSTLDSQNYSKIDLLTSNVSTINISLSNINNNLSTLDSNLNTIERYNSIPPNNEPKIGDTYSDFDKYFFKDGVERPISIPFIDENYFFNGITGANNFITSGSKNFISFSYNLINNIVLKDDVSKYLNNNQRLLPLYNLPSSYDMSSWAPPIYDQGNNGSCYANAVSTALAFAQNRVFKAKYNLSDELLKSQIANILPSRVYIEYIYNKWRNVIENSDLFDQAGQPEIALTLCNLLESFPLEKTFSYPKINNVSREEFSQFSNDTKKYLIAEWYKKRIFGIDTITKDIIKGYPFYKNIFTMYSLFQNENYTILSNNSLYGLLQKKNELNEPLFFDENGNESTTTSDYAVPLYTYLERVNLYKTFLNKNYPLIFTFPVFSSDVNNQSDIWFDGAIYSNNGLYLGNHAVVIIGYDDNKVCNDGSTGAFKVQNSWGSNNGENGYRYIPYTMINFQLSYNGIKNYNGGYQLTSICTAVIDITNVQDENLESIVAKNITFIGDNDKNNVWYRVYENDLNVSKYTQFEPQEQP